MFEPPITDLNYGLPDLLKLRPVSFTWIAQPQQGTQLGFIAQDVRPLFPEIVNVGDDSNHTLGLTYTEFIPIIVKAIQQIAQEIDGFAQSFTTQLLTAATGHFSNELCVGSTCVTPAQFQAMVAAANQSSARVSDSSLSTSASDPETEVGSSSPPVIQINGDNPAIIQIGATYDDLGATITGPQADLNLGIHTFVANTPIDQVVIDTSAATTYHINYVATDAAGKTSTSTRTVIVQAANTIPPPSDTSTTTQATSTAQ